MGTWLFDGNATINFKAWCLKPYWNFQTCRARIPVNNFSLYCTQMILHKKLERRRKRRDDHKPEPPAAHSNNNNHVTSKVDASDDLKEQVPPSEPSPMEKSPSPSSPLSPHPQAAKFSPGKGSPMGPAQASEGVRPDSRQYQAGQPKIGNPGEFWFNSCSSICLCEVVTF